MSDFQRVDYQVLWQQVAAKLQAAGVPEENAAVEAQIMAEADLLEVPSHGVKMLPGLLKAISEGRVNAATEIRTLRSFGAIEMIDCGNGPGRYSSATAMARAVRAAKQFGVGVCLASRTSHWGRAHAYAFRAAQEGCIGFCTTNAKPTMAAWGAGKPVIGNNPLAIATPAPADAPVVLDMAMSQAAVGKVATWLREGKTVEQGWGVDENGNPSTDAAAILKGAVAPMGGHKGAGLALMFELMTAALSGGAFTQQIASSDNSGIDPDATKIFVALNVEAFIDKQQFNEQVQSFLQYLGMNASPFNYPGQRGWQAREKNVKAGVPLHTEIAEQLTALGLQF